MSTPDLDTKHEVDARGMSCPLPILKAKKALAAMLTGERLTVITTDPSAQRDFQAFARQSGNELVEQVQDGEIITHVLRRR